jgi:cardiolipin synthase
MKVSPAVEAELKRLKPADANLIRLLATINDIPPSVIDESRLLVDAQEFYPSLLEELKGAKHHIHLVFFVWRNDQYGTEFLEALIDAAKRGVEVRLLLDQFGCWGLGNDFCRELLEAGGKFAWFYSLPYWKHARFMNLRNHRKLQIIDGHTAFVGGMNVGREYMGEDEQLGGWRDAQVRVRGEVTTLLQEVFATDWFFATDERLVDDCYYPRCPGGKRVAQVIAGGPDIPREVIPKTLLAILGTASKRVWISTGYFVPDTLFLTALQLCAARKVDVRLLISEKTDHPYLVRVGQSFYPDLLQWGVRVFEYSEKINHKKAVLYDDDWLMIGSANSDNRSMRLNFELNLFYESPEDAARLAAVFEAEFALSREVRKEDLAQRTLKERMIEGAFRPLAPML